MSNEKQQSRERRVDRREFFEIGVKTAAARAVLPAASLAFAGCGSGEERPAPAVPDPTRAAGRQSSIAASSTLNEINKSRSFIDVSEFKLTKDILKRNFYPYIKK